MCSRGHWRPAEDEKLRELVEHYGPHNWNAIAEKLRGRSGETIIMSYYYFLILLATTFYPFKSNNYFIRKYCGNDRANMKRLAPPNSFNFVVVTVIIVKFY